MEICKYLHTLYIYFIKSIQFLQVSALRTVGNEVLRTDCDCHVRKKFSIRKRIIIQTKIAAIAR